MVGEAVTIEKSWREKVALYYADKYANDMEWFIDRINKRLPERFLLLESFSQHIRENEMISWYKIDPEIKQEIIQRAKEWNRQEDDRLIECFCKIVYFMNQVFEKYYE